VGQTAPIGRRGVVPVWSTGQTNARTSCKSASCQFAVANPATLGLAFRSGASAITFGQHSTIVFAASSDGAPLPGARVLVSTRQAGQASFGPARMLTASASGLVTWSVAPARTTTYRTVVTNLDPRKASKQAILGQRAFCDSCWTLSGVPRASLEAVRRQTSVRA
jgi:hypothetical protein